MMICICCNQSVEQDPSEAEDFCQFCWENLHCAGCRPDFIRVKCQMIHIKNCSGKS